MATVQLVRLQKLFGKTVAVDSIDLEVRDQELIVLVGPSGCGKTTTLRMIAGLETPTAGEIHIGGTLVNHVPPKDRNIAMVFQKYALYPHMNVYNNMAFGLKMRGVARTEIEQRIQQAAEILGIGDLLKRTPAQLSGGQQQRVAVGRAIVRDPQVFLFDEPLSNLDAKLRVKMRTELVKLHRRLQATIVYVTHDQVEAMMMGDRIVVMNDGRIQQVGEPLEVYHQPANRFVAEFIGSPPMNFLAAELDVQNDQPIARVGDAELPLPADRIRQDAVRPGRSVVVGIRPEDVRLGDSPDGNGWCGLPAEVVVAQPLGADTIVELAAQQHELLARVDSQQTIRGGEKVDAQLNLSRCHIFDAETEDALRP